MKMAKACLAPIWLRFSTKSAFDSFTDELQYSSGVAHRLIEHHKLDPAVAFVKPQMVGGNRVNRLKRVGFCEDQTYVRERFWRRNLSFSGITAAEPRAAETQHDNHDPVLGRHDKPPQKEFNSQTDQKSASSTMR